MNPELPPGFDDEELRKAFAAVYAENRFPLNPKLLDMPPSAEYYAGVAMLLDWLGRGSVIREDGSFDPRTVPVAPDVLRRFFLRISTDYLPQAKAELPRTRLRNFSFTYLVWLARCSDLVAARIGGSKRRAIEAAKKKMRERGDASLDELQDETLEKILRDNQDEALAALPPKYRHVAEEFIANASEREESKGVRTAD